MTATVLDDAPTAPPTSLAPRARAFVRRHCWSLAGFAASVLLVGLVLLASLPTGVPTAARTVPAGARLAAHTEVSDVQLLILSKGGALSAQVAYRGPKGWLGAPLHAAPSSTVAAWSGTKGAGPIPPLAVVYGRAPGSSVRVDWADGRHTTVRTARDGVYVVGRDRYVASKAVHVLDGDGAVVLTIEGP